MHTARCPAAAISVAGELAGRSASKLTQIVRMLLLPAEQSQMHCKRTICLCAGDGASALPPAEVAALSKEHSSLRGVAADYNALLAAKREACTSGPGARACTSPVSFQLALHQQHACTLWKGGNRRSSVKWHLIMHSEAACPHNRRRRWQPWLVRMSSCGRRPWRSSAPWHCRQAWLACDAPLCESLSTSSCNMWRVEQQWILACVCAAVRCCALTCHQRVSE
jgi:hypothetical protein